MSSRAVNPGNDTMYYALHGGFCDVTQKRQIMVQLTDTVRDVGSRVLDLENLPEDQFRSVLEYGKYKWENKQDATLEQVLEGQVWKESRLSYAAAFSIIGPANATPREKRLHQLAERCFSNEALEAVWQKLPVSRCTQNFSQKTFHYGVTRAEKIENGFRADICNRKLPNGNAVYLALNPKQAENNMITEYGSRENQFGTRAEITLEVQVSEGALTDVAEICDFLTWEEALYEHVVQPVNAFSRENRHPLESYGANGMQDILPCNVVNYVAGELFRAHGFKAAYVSDTGSRCVQVIGGPTLAVFDASHVKH